MRRFDYWCKSCEHKFEEFLTTDAVIRCPLCNDDSVRRLISAPTIHMTTISDSKLREEFKEDYY